MDTTRARNRNQSLRADEIEPGSCKLGRVGDKQVAVFNVDGKFFATQLHCTHENGPLCDGALWGEVVICPWHGSQFNVRTGEVVGAPADRPLTTYPVSVVNGEVLLELSPGQVTETPPEEFN